MPKVTEEHRSARKSQIAHAAMRLFARQGFQSTSMADIIAESGLSAGAIYGHFRGKEDIIQSAISELLDLDYLTSDLGRGAPPPPPGVMMQKYIETIEGEMNDASLLVQVWGQAVLDPSARLATDRVGEQLRKVFGDYLARWYRDGLGMTEDSATSAAQHFAPLYLGMMQGCILQSAIFGQFDRTAYFAAASELRPA